MNCINSFLAFAMSFLAVSFPVVGQVEAPSAMEGGKGFINTQTATTYGKGYWGINFHGLYHSVALSNLPGREHLWVGSGSMTYDLTDEIELSGVLYGIGQGFFYTDHSRPDVFATGLGASKVAMKFRIPLTANDLGLAGRIALNMPAGRNFVTPASDPYETSQWGLELMALQSFKFGRSVRWHLNQGYRWQGLQNDHQPNDDLLLIATAFDYDLGRKWLAYSELSSVVEMDNKIQPLQDRLVFTQGVQYLTPWNLGVNLAANIGLSQKPEDGSPKRAAGWQVVAGFSFGARTHRPDDDRDGIPNFSDFDPYTPNGWSVDSHGRALDSDNDGIADAIDKEPHTVDGALVDKDGRAIDSDKDGIPDGIDDEPYSPIGALVDAHGRTVDSDGDGIPDGIDQEPNTPKGAVIDARGIAFDSDGDGVPDGIDLEPGTPKGIFVDAYGRALPPMEIELLTKGLLRVHRIHFDVGSAMIKPEAYAVLNEIGRILEKYPDLQIQISGHTDSKGSDKFNDQLSYERALAVRGYLLTHFPALLVDNLTVKGQGRNMPLADNQTEAGRSLNRRVEFAAMNSDKLFAAKIQESK